IQPLAHMLQLSLEGLEPLENAPRPTLRLSLRRDAGRRQQSRFHLVVVEPTWHCRYRAGSFDLYGSQLVQRWSRRKVASQVHTKYHALIDPSCHKPRWPAPTSSAAQQRRLSVLVARTERAREPANSLAVGRYRQ